MKRLAFLLLATLAVPVLGQSVKLPAEVKGDPGTIVVVKAQTDCTGLRWLPLDPGLSQIPPNLLKDSRTAVVMAGKPGRYRLLAYGALKDAASEPAVCTVVIGEPTPPPPPGPGPKPPPPDPKPGDLPIEGEGFRVLILEEQADRTKLTPGQFAAIFNTATRDYMNARCVAGEGGRKEWNIWDKDVDASAIGKRWVDAMSRAKKNPNFKTPWIALSNGKQGFEGPLPPTLGEALELMKKYGGN